MQPQWEVADVLRNTHFEGYNVQQQKHYVPLKTVAQQPWADM